MAERGGFEPPVRFHVRRISSAVHSTTLPPLRGPKVPNGAERAASLIKGRDGRKPSGRRNLSGGSTLSGKRQAEGAAVARFGPDVAEQFGGAAAGVAGENARGLDQAGAFDA